MKKRKALSLRLSRDAILFVLGVLGIANETLLQSGERPTLLLLFAAMIGLPAFLRQDDKKIAQVPETPKPPEPTVLVEGGDG